MALDTKSPPAENASRKMLSEFFIGMAVIWLMWVFSGGPARVEQGDQPFLKPPGPLNSGKDFGILPDIQFSSVSDLKKNIKINDGSLSSYSSEASISLSLDKETGREILEVVALSKNKRPINITGWVIKNVVESSSKVIGKGAGLFRQGRISEESDIVLDPGEKAVILAGNSPVGASFRLNKCSGYLEQFQAFLPHLPQYCPHPGLDSGGVIGDYKCNLFLSSILRCNAYVKEFPTSISDECKNIVNKRFNYNGCVDEHLNDTDFKKGEWRVYLGGNDSFGSKDGDLISIFDQKGTLIDTIFYNQ